MSAFLGELIGTALLIVLGGGVCAGVSLKKSFAKDSGWIVITMGWGLAVAVAAYAVGSISGAHLNPALTIGLAFKGAFPWSDVPGYIAAQMIGTFVLVFGILAIGANKFADGLNPFIVGFLIVSIGLSLGGTTGYAINPARDLGPRIAHFFLPIAGKGGSNWKYAWIPVVGPILGGSLAGLFHQVVFEGKQNAALIYVIIATVIVLAISYMTSKKSGSNTNSRKVA